MLDPDPLEVVRLAILHATQNEMSGHDTRRLISDALDRASERIYAAMAAERERCARIVEDYVGWREAERSYITSPDPTDREALAARIRATPPGLVDSPA